MKSGVCLAVICVLLKRTEITNPAAGTQEQHARTGKSAVHKTTPSFWCEAQSRHLQWFVSFCRHIL